MPTRLKNRRAFVSKLGAEFQDLRINDFSLFLRLLAFDLGRRIVLKTAVDTGKLRGDWRMSLNTRQRQRYDRLRPEAADVISEMLIVVAGITATNTRKIFIENRQPYGSFIEEGRSAKARVGMVQVSIDEINSRYSRVEDVAVIDLSPLPDTGRIGGSSV